MKVQLIACLGALLLSGTAVAQNNAAPPVADQPRQPAAQAPAAPAKAGQPVSGERMPGHAMPATWKCGRSKPTS